MNKLRKRSTDSYNVLVDVIANHIYDRVPFFYNNKNDGRFFTPKYTIFFSDNPKAEQYDDKLIGRIATSLLDVISLDLTIASYIDSLGRYRVSVGTTTKSCIEAVRSAKINSEDSAIDLITQKLYKTNG